jgi:hypothetical protein
MVLESDIANLFVREYTAFLLYCYIQRDDENCDDELLYKLSQGRDAYERERTLFEEYLDSNKEVPLAIANAIRSLMINNWAYLRDTTKYSLFINTEGTSAFAVLGLTQPIKELFGCSGLYMKAGVFCLNGQYVCDGLITDQVILGKGYRDQFNEIYRELKSTGNFFKSLSA